MKGRLRRLSLNDRELQRLWHEAEEHELRGMHLFPSGYLFIRRPHARRFGPWLTHLHKSLSLAEVAITTSFFANLTNYSTSLY